MVMRNVLVILGFLSTMTFYAQEAMSQEDIIHTDITFERKGCADCGFITLENIRGENDQKAYDNQDRGCAITIKKPVIHPIDRDNISVIDLVRGRIPVPQIDPGIFVVGVFDGHGKYGDAISSLTQFLVCDYFKKFFEYSKTKILYHDFLVLGRSVQSVLECNSLAQESGTTGCFCMLEGPFSVEGNGQIYRAVFSNIGDSRAIVVSDNEVVFSTVDHKPITPSENSRIETAGGYVYNGYGWGSHGHGFALSRSWGDCVAHANGIISATPEVHSFGVPTQASNSLLKIKEKTSYLVSGDCIVFATDGLWDVMTSQEVAEYIYTRKRENVTMQTISEELAHKARNGENLAQEKSKDDITIIIVEL